MPAAQRILFICLHGSAKSIIAAEHLRRLASSRGIEIDAVAAGIEPDQTIPPNVVAGLLADGIDVRGRRPIGVSQRLIADAEHIVSFGCDMTEVADGTWPVEYWRDVPQVSDDYTAARQAIMTRLMTWLDRSASR